MYDKYREKYQKYRDVLEAQLHEKLVECAENLVLDTQTISVSFIQRALQLGYHSAHEVVSELETRGIVSLADHHGKRTVLQAKA